METQSMEERLGRLEEKLSRTERRYRFVLASLGTAVITSVVIWVALGTAGRAQAQKPTEATKVIRAKGFILEDENGKTRAQLSMNELGPGLVLYDENGNGLAVLYTFKLSFFDEKREVRARLLVTGRESVLDLFDEKGVCRTGLRFGYAGPGLWLYDEKGEARSVLNAGGRGPMLSLSGETGEAGAGLAVLRDKPGLSMWDEKGRTIWSAP